MPNRGRLKLRGFPPIRGDGGARGGNHRRCGRDHKAVFRYVAGVAQLEELQPSKLEVASSNLVSRSIFLGPRTLPRLQAAAFRPT